MGSISLVARLRRGSPFQIKERCVTPDVAGMLALGLYATVAVGLIVRDIRRCRDGWAVWLLYIVERLYVSLMFRWRSNNRPCPLPADGAAIVISNHRCPVDPQFVWVNHHFRAGRRDVRVISYLTAAEYCDMFGLRFIVRSMRSIPVHRDGKDLTPVREALRRLKNGEIVGVFPEGRINYGTDLLEPTTGVAFMALKAKVPVYPVFIHDAPQIGTSMVAPFVTRCRVRVTYGDPIDLTAYFERKTSPELLAEVTNLLMSRLAELGGVGFTKAEG